MASLEFNELKEELKKGAKFIPASFSFIALSIFLGRFLVVYLGLPSELYGTSIGLLTVIALIDAMGKRTILESARKWWTQLPYFLHFWIIIDCLAYYCLLKAYLKERPLWKDLLNN